MIPTPLLHVVANFADHHHRLAAAVAARGETIVTGDRKHLLPIGTNQRIPTVAAHEAVDRLDAGCKT